MAAVAVEDLQRVNARGDLHLQIQSDGGSKLFRQRVIGFRVFAEQLQRATVFRHAGAFHHERCQRPRRSAEAEERGLVAEFLAQHPQRLVHVTQPLEDPLNGEFFNVRLGLHREIHDHAAGFLEMIRLPQCFGNHQDVAKQDRGVKTEPAHGLEGHFDGQLGILHQLDEGVSLLQLAVFRQSAPGLPHQPHRRAIHRLAAGGSIESLAIRQRRRGGWDGGGGNIHLFCGQIVNTPHRI